MHAVEFAKVIIGNYGNIVITAWRAPGSHTVSSTVKWGDGTYSPVISDKHTSLSPLAWIDAKYGVYKQDKVAITTIAA